MGISAKTLGQDEFVVLSIRTHWKALVWPVVLAILVAAAAGAGVAFMPVGEYQQWLQIGVVGAGVLVILIFAMWPILNWLASTYTVTNKRLITRHGIITRTGRDLPLTRINDVSHERQISDRLLGCGTLVIETASEQGRVVLPDVPRVQAVQRQISELLFSRHDDDDGARRPPPP